MRASANHVISILLSVYICARGSPIDDDLISKRDGLSQEAFVNDLSKRDIDQRDVITDERALDTLNEGKRRNDDTDVAQRSDQGQQSQEGLKRASGKYRDLLTLVRRGWFSDAWETVKNTASSVGDTIKKGYNTVKDKIDETVDAAKEKWDKFKDLVGREASASSSVKLSNIGNFLDRRDLHDVSGYHDDERRSHADDELERRDERTDASSDVRRAVEALRDLQD